MNHTPLLRTARKLTCWFWWLLGAASQAGQTDGGTFRPIIDETKGATLFAFDQVSIPFTRSLRLEVHKPEKYAGNPIVARGAPGETDSWAIHFYGSVLRENGKFRLWYVGTGDERGQRAEHNSSLWRLLYAESTDGIRWTKPKLGLVDYRGSKANNILRLEPFMGLINAKVLHEPEDPNPAHRYKLAAHVYFLKKYPDGQSRRHGTLAPYVSADGLTWKLLGDAQPKDAEMPEASVVLPPVHFEPAGGLYKWDGFYYSSGQNPIPALRPYHARVAKLYRSSDFATWSQTSSVSFVRSTQHGSLGGGREGEQSHEGIAVWNRHNVLLGLVGQWHGARAWTGVTIDLGFVVSNDGLNFREPAHEMGYITIGPDGTWDEGGIMQAQGFEQVGDKTYVYYGSGDLRTWTEYRKPIPPRGGVGLVTLPRDRFGDLRVQDTGEGPAEFVTSAIAAGAARRIYLNADGLGPAAALKLELLTYEERPLRGYSGAEAAVVRQSGFQVPVSWPGSGELRGLPERFKIKATFEGARKDAIRFHALYLQK